MFIDTSGMLCYNNAAEPEHETAKRHFRRSRRKVTHSYVLAEFVTLSYARGYPRLTVIALTTDFLAHPQVEIVWVDEALHLQAMALLEARPDKEYSLCDAVSFVLMRERGIYEALATDHHFGQEGFTRLLRPPTEGPHAA
jgi:predicted nucleic acid-binding protein